MRQAIDLEHWAAFRRSFEAVANVRDRDLSLPVASGGRPPTSIGFLSGDVHYSYLACACLVCPLAGRPRRPGSYQAVCSPFRNPLPPFMQRGHRTPPPGARLGAFARRPGPVPARVARVRRWTWGITEGPWYDNNLATLELQPGRACGCGGRPARWSTTVTTCPVLRRVATVDEISG